MLARIVMLCSIIVLLTNSGVVLSGEQAVYARAAASVIRIDAIVPDRGSAQGSGVALPDGRVVTNCHVTRNAKSLVLTDATTQLLAQPNDSDFAADVCVLTTGILTAPPAPLGSSRDLKVGDAVFAIGFSGGQNKKMSSGHITALYPYRGGFVMRTSAAFRSGASGGGLFDRDGRLVGIITFVLDRLSRCVAESRSAQIPHRPRHV